ncbi:MAG: hypothetical protein GXY52_04795 [Chloroflexi bacterium]|nr:hypothetical protein [Chloroflexota bacterium]
MTKPFSEIKSYRGAPTIHVDGQPIAGSGFWRSLNADERYLADFHQLGVRLVWFSVGTNYWLANGRYDFSSLDQAWERMLKAAPEAYFIPRLYLRPPDWWTNANPKELRMTENGEPYRGTPDEYLDGQVLPSSASTKWRDDTRAYIRAFIEHHEASPFAERIIGYHLSNEQSEEWFYWGGPDSDYNPQNVVRFRDYLETIYASDEALQEAWADPQVTLACTQLPRIADRRSPQEGEFFSPAAQQQVVDYYRYKHTNMVDIISDFTHLAKDLTDRRALVGVFYGYQLQSIPRGQLDSGHYALAKLLALDSVDYLSSPTCYAGRELGSGYSYFMSLQASVRLHGKLWIDENDIRTHVPAPSNEGFGKTLTLADTISMQRRELANALCNGAAYWWMDQGGGWYADPKLLQELGWLHNLMTKAMQGDRSSRAEVAVVIDEGSVMWRASRSRLQSHMGITEIGHLGAPVDFILLSDLEEARDYKLYYFKYCYRQNRALRAMIRRVLERSQGMAVWIDKPGWIDEDARTAGIDNAQQLTGLQIPGVREPGVREPGVRSVWLQDLPDAAALRELCREAGVHIYVDSGDVVYADASFITVHSQEAGEKELTVLPGEQLTDVVRNCPLETADGVARLTMDASSTAIIYRGNRSAWNDLQ